MDGRLLDAATSGDATTMKQLALHDPAVLLGTTPQGNTCLHIASMHGHEGFCREALDHDRSLLSSANADEETPLLTAVKNGHTMLASFLLAECCSDIRVRDTVLKQQDRHGFDALHHAIRNGHTDLALELIAAQRGFLSTPSQAMIKRMDRRLLDAATSGDATAMKDLARQDPALLLLPTTPRGNTCLHIASMHGHEGFCREALDLIFRAHGGDAMHRSLLSSVNKDVETPLLTAVTNGHTRLASFLLTMCCSDIQLSREAVLKQDKLGCNALHHAIRNGHRDLALELIAAQPDLSKAVNRNNESPMFIAVMRNCVDVFDELLEIPDSAHGGACGFNALHAAVRNGNSAIAKKIMETRPGLAREEENDGKNTPIQQAVLWNKIDVLRILLEHDRSLGYVFSSKGYPLLVSAAFRGHVDVARELLNHCPDAPYCETNGWTCLHEAVQGDQMEFVEFILGSPQLRKLCNMQNSYGETALHIAVRDCNPKMVAALLLRRDTDVTVLNNNAAPAIWRLSGATDHAKTLNWNEVSMLMLKADPQNAGSIYNLHKETKGIVTGSSRKDIRLLTQTYTGNTSLVAILMATITFAAAFTLPGGYSSDGANEGLPIMAKKTAFQAFLISDTLAMCSSLAVAFLCIIARWEDLEFLIYYRSFTKKLMWFAYMATTTAFAAGLYTVLAPRLLWLAIAIWVVSVLLPFLTKLVGEWPVLKLRIRLGRRTFKSDLLNMV